MKATRRGFLAAIGIGTAVAHADIFEGMMPRPDPVSDQPIDARPQARYRIRPSIIEGIMDRVLDEIGRVHWNATQAAWGARWDAPFTPLAIGSISVEIEDCEGNMLMHVGHGDHKVSTWLDGKRLYYHAHYPEGWSVMDFIEWAELVFQELNRVERATEIFLRGRPESRSPR